MWKNQKCHCLFLFSQNYLLMSTSSSLQLCPGQYSSGLSDVTSFLYELSDSIGVCQNPFANIGNMWDQTSDTSQWWNTNNNNNQWYSSNTGSYGNIGGHSWGRKKRQAVGMCSTFYMFCLQPSAEQTCA